MERALLTVDVDRRGYGRRYTGLPVDAINREGLMIDCTGGYMLPERFDLLPGDIIRWEEGARRIEAHIVDVQREGMQLRASLANPVVLPPDFFAP